MTVAVTGSRGEQRLVRGQWDSRPGFAGRARQLRPRRDKARADESGGPVSGAKVQWARW